MNHEHPSRPESIGSICLSFDRLGCPHPAVAEPSTSCQLCVVDLVIRWQSRNGSVRASLDNQARACVKTGIVGIYGLRKMDECVTWIIDDPLGR